MEQLCSRNLILGFGEGDRREEKLKIEEGGGRGRGGGGQRDEECSGEGSRINPDVRAFETCAS